MREDEYNLFNLVPNVAARGCFGVKRQRNWSLHREARLRRFLPRFPPSRIGAVQLTYDLDEPWRITDVDDQTTRTQSQQIPLNLTRTLFIKQVRYCKRIKGHGLSRYFRFDTELD